MSSHQVNRLKNNNFDLLRLIFAASVCFVHAYELSGYQELEWIKIIFSSDVAIKAFFVVSGFLILMSYERSSSVNSYFGKRIRRIYPAYATIILIAALGFCLISTQTLTNYFSAKWINYLAANLVFLNFLEPTLPSVFEENRFNAVNGALWTLKIEMMFYLIVPIIAYLCRKFTPVLIIVLIYAGSLTYVEILTGLATTSDKNIYNVLARQLPGQMSYFMAGAFFYYYLDTFSKYMKFILPIAVVIFLGKNHFPLNFAEPFALATLVIFCGLFCYLGNFGKFGDFSYGIYIIHFPLIQLFLHFGWFASKPLLFFSSIVACTLIGGILMWHLVEKHFLLRNNHYRSSASTNKLPATN